MNKIYYSANTDSIMEQIYATYNHARGKDEYFDASNYEWRLGVKLVYEIQVDAGIIYKMDAPMELYGIPVSRDYHNPERCELWKNVTND